MEVEKAVVWTVKKGEVYFSGVFVNTHDYRISGQMGKGCRSLYITSSVNVLWTSCCSVPLVIRALFRQGEPFSQFLKLFSILKSFPIVHTLFAFNLVIVRKNNGCPSDH